MRRRALALGTLVAVAVCCSQLLATAAEAPKDSPKIELRERGRVEGSVVDRATQQPLAGARVVVAEDGVFAETGKTVDLTDKAGRFRVETLLGTRASKFDLEQALLTFPLGFLIPGGVNRVTKVLYVTQFNLQVELVGYQPFLAPIQAMAADANRYAVELNPVLLAATTSTSRSYAPPGEANLCARKFVVTPTIVGRDRTIRIEAELVLPRHYGYVAAWVLPLDQPADWALTQLQARGRLDERTRVLKFAGELVPPRRPRERIVTLSLVTARERARFGTRVEGATALVQLVQSPEEGPVAELIAQGHDLERRNESAAAFGRYEEAAQLADFVELELAQKRLPLFPRGWLDQRRGAVLLKLNRPQEAVAVLERLAMTQRERPEAYYADFGAALLECGQVERALNLLLPLTKDRKRAHGLPPEYYLTLARCYLEQGELAHADEFYVKAARDALWGTEFVQQFNLARVRAALKSDPANPDLQLAEGRSLADLGRFEAALGVYRTLLERDANQPWIFLDIAQALTKLQRPDQARVVLLHALELQPTNLEAQDALVDLHLQLGQFDQAFEVCKPLAESPARQRDFTTRHRWALLLLSRGNVGAAMRELEHAIYLSRGRSEVRFAGLPSPYGVVPFGAKRSLSTGFNRLEAERDFIILQALRELERNPSAALAELNLGVALVESGFAPAGRERLLRAQQAGLELPELHCALGAAAAQLGDVVTAERELQVAVKLEPLCGTAYRKLAELAAAGGEVDLAQHYLLKLATLSKGR